MSFMPNCKEVNSKIQKNLKVEGVIQSFNINSNGTTINQVLSVDVHPKVENVSTFNGGCEINGITKVKILIINKENEYVVLEDSLSFSTKVQDPDISETSKVLASTKVTETRGLVASENNVTFSATLLVDACLIKVQTFKYVEGIEDSACQKKVDFCYSDIAASFNQNCELVNEVNLPNSISKILSVNGNCVLENCSAGDDMITASGKVFSTILFLTNEDEPKIKSQEYILDFCEEMLASGVSAGNVINAKTILNDISFEVQGEMNSSKGVLTIKSELCVLGFAEKRITLNGVADAFCPTHDLVCESSNFVVQKSDVINLREKIDGSLSLTDDVQMDKVLCVSGAYVTYSITQNDNNGAELIGVLHANVIYKLDDENGTIGAVVAELPFTKQIDDCKYNAMNSQISVSSIEARSKRSKDIDIQAELIIAINYSQNETQSIISNVQIGDKLKSSFQPMGLYVVSGANELWDVAKELRINPDVVMSQNPNLKFPITEPTKVLVYRQFCL